MRRRLLWWRRRNAIFELYLLMLVTGWSMNLFLTDVFDSNDLYVVMGQIAEQHVWALLLVGWLVLYAAAVWFMSRRGRIVALFLIAWWWASVAIMLAEASPISTGVVAYGATSLSCIMSFVSHTVNPDD
jgi:hypothetical protein